MVVIRPRNRRHSMERSSCCGTTSRLATRISEGAMAASSLNRARSVCGGRPTRDGLLQAGDIWRPWHWLTFLG
jgi:hypothetical protein